MKEETKKQTSKKTQRSFFKARRRKPSSCLSVLKGLTLQCSYLLFSPRMSVAPWVWWDPLVLRTPRSWTRKLPLTFSWWRVKRSVFPSWRSFAQFRIIRRQSRRFETFSWRAGVESTGKWPKMGGHPIMCDHASGEQAHGKTTCIVACDTRPFSPWKVFYTLLRHPNLLQCFLTPWLSNACVQTFFTSKYDSWLWIMFHAGSVIFWNYVLETSVGYCMWN